MERTWEIEKTWRRRSRHAKRYEVSATDGHRAASLCITEGEAIVVLSPHLDRECGLGLTRRMPYDEAQVLLARFDLTLPPLPEVTSE